MSSTKARLMKTIFTAPLALGLVLGTASCTTSTTEPESTSNMPQDVKANIENSMSSMIGLYGQNEDFLEAIFTLGSTGGELKGFDEEMKLLDGFIANDKALEEVKKSAQESFAEDKNTKIDDKTLVSISKATPLMLMAYSYNFDSPKVAVEIDPSGFENKDGIWVQSKEGAVSFKDEGGKYLAFTSTDDYLSFTQDGKQFTLAALSDSLEKAEKSNTDVMKTVGDAAEKSMTWFGANLKSLNEEEQKDFSKVQTKVLKDFKPTGDTTLEMKGNATDGFTIVGKSSKTGEVVTYSTESGQLTSSLDEAEPTLAKTTGRELFDEYVDTYYTSAEQDEEYDTLEQVIESVNKNETLKDAKWSLSEIDGQKIPVASYAGKEYKFQDVTKAGEQDGTTGDTETELDKGKTGNELIMPESENK